MIFQTSDYKGNNFFNLANNNNLLIRPTYLRRRAWLKYLKHSNSPCVQATKAIINHISISKYCLRFFPRKLFECLCKIYSIKSRYHVLYDYRRYNKY